MELVDPAKLSKTLNDKGEDWADKDAAFYALEEAKKSVLSECIGDLNEDGSHASLEAKALRSKKYKDHLKATAGARKAKNRSRVNYDAFQVYVDLVRSREATERQLAGMR